MVFKSSTQKRDLVTPDYYAKELKYQEKIDAVKRTQTLSTTIKYEIVNKQMVLNFPEEFTGKSISGAVLLYCPSDNNKDVEQNFSTAAGTFTFPLPAKNKGAHEIQVSWQVDGKSYYFESKVIL